MPFKTIFRSHKKIKESTKLGVHFTPDHHFHTSEEPPDGGRILDQIKHMKLQKQKTSGHGRGNNTGISSSGFAPPPLYRAATAPLPVITHSVQDSVSSSRRVRKSASLGESLDWRHSPELDLHDKRLKDLTQLESYISYLQHTSDDDASLYMSNRLCCAQVLKALYMRHERPYVSLRRGKSPSSPDAMAQTNHRVQDKKRDIFSTVCDTCLTPLDDDIVFLPDVTQSDENLGNTHHQHSDLHSALKKPASADEPVSNFCRQRGGRIPVGAKRRGLKVSLSLTPMVGSSSSEGCRLTTEDDRCKLIERKCGLDDLARDTTVDESSGESESKSVRNSISDAELSRCGSDLSLTPFTTMSVFQGTYEIY